MSTIAGGADLRSAELLELALLPSFFDGVEPLLCMSGLLSGLSAAVGPLSERDLMAVNEATQLRMCE